MSADTQIKISDEILDDYRKSADQWSPTLLDLPIAQAQDVLGFMTGVKGLRGTKHFPSVAAKSEFGPYNPDRVHTGAIDIKYRSLTTHMGSVIERFHPNEYSMLTMGYQSQTVGDGQKSAKPSLLVLSQISKAHGAALSYAVFHGVRNPEGEKTVDLFDGFNTIAHREIDASNLLAAERNLYVLPEPLSKVNTCDILKDVVYAMNTYLRRQACFLFCSQQVADFYNESYLLSHPSVPYNKEFAKSMIEGSNVTIVPLPQLDGSDLFFIAPKSNFLWGTDNISKQSFVQVDRFEPFRLTFSATMFFGVNFYSIDPRMLMVIQAPEGTLPTPPEEGSDAGSENP